MTDDATYEELEQPRRHGRALSAIVILVAAAIVTVRLGTQSTNHPSAAAVSTPTAVSSASLPPPGDVRDEGPPAVALLHFQEPPECPRATDGQVACITYKFVPLGVRRAVRALKPALVIDMAITQVLRPTGPEDGHGLWSLQLTGHAAALHVRVAIARRDTGDRLQAASAGTMMRFSDAYAFARRDRGRYTIQIELRWAHVNPYKLMTSLGVLASDRRLLRPALPPSATMVP